MLTLRIPFQETGVIFSEQSAGFLEAGAYSLFHLITLWC